MNALGFTSNVSRNKPTTFLLKSFLVEKDLSEATVPHHDYTGTIDLPCL